MHLSSFVSFGWSWYLEFVHPHPAGHPLCGCTYQALFPLAGAGIWNLCIRIPQVIHFADALIKLCFLWSELVSGI